MPHLNCSVTQTESQGQKHVSIMQSLVKVKAFLAHRLSLHFCLLQISAGRLAFLPIAQSHSGCKDVKIRAVQSKPPGLPMVTVCYRGATLCCAYSMASSVPFVPKFPDSRAPTTEAGPYSL